MADTLIEKPFKLYNDMYNPTCFFTGEKSNLKMHPIRNDNGDMVGWIFVQNAIDMRDSELNHTYKITQAAQDMINIIKAMQPRVPEEDCKAESGEDR